MPYVKHVVISEDTLPAIAQRYLGDANRWMEIAILNDLKYPFIVDSERDGSTSPKVKAIGETLLIPIEDTLDDAPLYELQQGYDRLLGEDLDVFSSLLSPYGDGYIGLTEEGQAELSADGYGSIRTVKGIENLRQALLLRLMTPQGTLLHHPDYGSQLLELLGKQNDPNQLQKIKIELERVIRSDSRIEYVTITEVASDGKLISASIKVKPIGINQMLSLGLQLEQSGVISWA